MVQANIVSQSIANLIPLVLVFARAALVVRSSPIMSASLINVLIIAFNMQALLYAWLVLKDIALLAIFAKPTTAKISTQILHASFVHLDLLYLQAEAVFLLNAQQVLSSKISTVFLLTV